LSERLVLTWFVCVVVVVQ